MSREICVDISIPTARNQLANTLQNLEREKKIELHRKSIALRTLIEGEEEWEVCGDLEGLQSVKDAIDFERELFADVSSKLQKIRQKIDNAMSNFRLSKK